MIIMPYVVCFMSVQHTCAHITGYPDALCRNTHCGECGYEWYDGRTGSLLYCSGCIDRDSISRSQLSSWQTSDCETCSCQVYHTSYSSVHGLQHRF